MVKRIKKWICKRYGHKLIWLYHVSMEPTHIYCIRCGFEEEKPTEYFVKHLQEGTYPKTGRTR